MVRSVLIDASCQQYADEKMLKRAPVEVGVSSSLVQLSAVEYMCMNSGYMYYNVGWYHCWSSNGFERYRTSVCDHTRRV